MNGKILSVRNMYVGICIEYLNQVVTRGNDSTRILASVETKTPEVGTQERAPPPGISTHNPALRLETHCKVNFIVMRSRDTANDDNCQSL
jgi:hypothetical protein